MVDYIGVCLRFCEDWHKKGYLTFVLGVAVVFVVYVILKSIF